jgi:hypothetical protein
MRRIIFSSTACLQILHSSTFSQTVLRNVVDAPWYIRNSDLHKDLQKEMVTNGIVKFAKTHGGRLLHRVDIEAIQLLDNSELGRRLKGGKTV